MATPPRLVELECPKCRHQHWEIDCDFRGAHLVGQRELSYQERTYGCPACNEATAGYRILQRSPPEFFLQPHDLYPMTRAEFDHWVGILETHFPDHPTLSRLGTTFRPRLPEEAEALKEAHARAYPVIEMKDQSGARRREPDMRVAGEWLEIMKPGDVLVFTRRDGGSLDLRLEASGYSGSCRDPAGAAMSHAVGLDERSVREAIQRYLSGDSAGCARYLRGPNAAML